MLGDVAVGHPPAGFGELEEDVHRLGGGPDDYSVVFVRRVVAGQVVTKVVAHSVGGASVGGSQPTAELYRVDALADLNGDGRMEIVVGNRGWEWGGSTAFELRPDGSVAQVIQTGCGV